MKKILILTMFWSWGWWWAWKMASILENHLFEKYKTVTLVAFYDWWIFPIKWKKISIGTFWKNSFPWKWYFVLLPHIINTIRYIKKEKPDYVIGMWFYCNFLWLCAKRFLNFKLLLTQHEHLTTQMKNIKWYTVDGIVLYTIKKLIWKTKIVCVSKEVQRDAIEYYWINKEQTQTIYNWLDFDKIKELWNEKIDFNDKFIINVWRLDTWKNQELLIKAYSKSKIKNNYKLLLLWEWDKEKYLKDLCKNLDIKNSVIFAWFDKNPYKYLKKASLFCFTSLTEAFWLVVLESLILDIPVITVPVTWANEILDNWKYWVITKDWNEETIIKELDNFVENWWKQYDIEAKNKFLNENFSVDAMVKQYIDVLENL